LGSFCYKTTGTWVRLNLALGIGMRRFCRQKNWKNRSAKAMSKMLAKEVNFGQNEFEEAAF